MIRFTRLVPLALASIMLAGCASTDPQTPPASISASAEAPVGQGEEKPSQSLPGADLTIEWTGAEFTAQGAYTVDQVSQASETLTDYVSNGFANPDFLTGEWASNPTGARIAEELEGQFTAARLDYIRTLDPKSADPGILNDVNSVAFVLYPENETTIWKQADKKASIKASGLTFAEEPTNGTLNAKFTVEITVPVASATGKGESTTVYTLNTWLVDDAGTMKIDGYANAWKSTPYNAS